MKKLLLLVLAVALLHGCKSSHKVSDEGFSDSAQVLRISSTEEPSSLDPRQVRSLPAATVIHMLYDGLMRLNFHGKPVPAVAESVSHDADMKTFTFKLRESFWSNGDPVTAHDFVYSWTTQLDPKFPASNANQFYVIKGGKAAKDGKIPLDQVGVKALDARTLVVELETPTPYFLDLVCTHFYMPSHPKSTQEALISNGPFKFHRWKRQSELSMIKNGRFWDADEVRLDGIVILFLDEHTALRMFDNGEIGWVGSPMGTLPQDAIQTLKHQRRLQVVSAAGTHWFRFNTTKAPLNNSKMRKALVWALNRRAIVDHVTQGNQQPALAVVPPSLGLAGYPYFHDNDGPKGWYAFQEALEEMKLSKDDFPVITLCYGASDRNHKIAQAVQQQWLKTLGITVNLESCETKVFYEKIANKEFYIVAGSWFADIRDPINFLEIFKYKNNATNSTQWENADYMALLDRSSQETNPEERMKLMSQAEAILIESMPVAPLFFSAFNYVKDPNLMGVYFSDLGYLDLKYAFYSQ